MKNYNLKFKIIFTFLIVILISLIVFLIWGGLWSDMLKYISDEKANPVLDSFAQCLAEKKVIMYGADWCSHCQKEKANFGNAFKYVSYVECPKNAKKCLDIGIQGYPTWIFPDGKKLVGEQGLEKLAKESGCAL